MAYPPVTHRIGKIHVATREMRRTPTVDGLTNVMLGRDQQTEEEKKVDGVATV